jgi:hypothetical protein
MERLALKRLALGLAAVATIAIPCAFATAQDWHIHRHQNFGHYDFRDQFHDELDHRAFHRELVHREAHRYPMSWQQHERLHDALDHEAFHDYLADGQFHRAYDYRGGYYGYPSYPLCRGYSYPSYGLYNQPYGVSNFRPYSSRFGLSSPRWGVMYNMGY